MEMSSTVGGFRLIGGLGGKKRVWDENMHKRDHNWYIHHALYQFMLGTAVENMVAEVSEMSP